MYPVVRRTSSVVRKISHPSGIKRTTHDERRTTGIQQFYLIDQAGLLHGFDNERVKMGVKREKSAVGGAK
jgi:hypothetical protein